MRRIEEETFYETRYFFDGSWLFKVQAGVLKSKRIMSENMFPILIDFGKLSRFILKHVQENGFEDCKILGERHCCISVFNLPKNHSSWESKRICDLSPFLKNNDYEITKKDIETTVRGCNLRAKFASNAIASGFSKESIIRPDLKPWMVEKLSKDTYQEKQVDTTVVALVVASATTKSNEIHAIVAGDADILPAVKIAYPKYSKNILIVTTHPDELKAENRQTAFSYQDEDFEIPALYLQYHVESIMKGNAVKCDNCGGVFEYKAIRNLKKRIYCKDCELERT